jgi:hypothetical protein
VVGVVAEDGADRAAVLMARSSGAMESAHGTVSEKEGDADCRGCAGRTDGDLRPRVMAAQKIRTVGSGTVQIVVETVAHFPLGLRVGATIRKC